MGIIIVPTLLFLFVGCSTSSNPVGTNEEPEPEPEETIEIPKSLLISKVYIKSWPTKNSDDKTWDWNPFSILDRNPDLYVLLGEKDKSAEFRSVTIDDAYPGEDYDVSSEAKSSDKSLPLELFYNVSYTFSLHDNDGISADEFIGDKTIAPSSLYRMDNAKSFSGTLYCSNDVQLSIVGTWVYPEK